MTRESSENVDIGGIAGLPGPRVERLLAGVAGHSLDAVVLVGADLVGWATGYERYLGGPYALLIDDAGMRTLLLPAYEEGAAQEADPADAVVTFGDRTLGLNLDPQATLAVALGELANNRRVGIAGGGDGLLPGARDLSLLVHDVRLRKDAEELAAISAAFALALVGQRAVTEAAVPGVTEIELFGLAHSAAQREAARPLGFVSDLVSGPRTGRGFGPVNVAGGRRLEEHDVVVADVAVGSAYWGDTARTTIVGEPDGDVISARTEIQTILDAVPAQLTPGRACSDVYRWVRSAITERLPGWEFPHHAGHGVGVSAFEDPHLIPTDDTPLEPGMVLAIEPGAYLPGRFGVRIEDMFVVGDRAGIRLPG